MENMSAVATSSAINPKRHRTSTDESDYEDYLKRPRYYYILEPGTTDYSSDGSVETILSIQGKTTDSAKDTPDTLSKSDDSQIEFEVISNSDEPVCPFPTNDTSSPEDVALINFEIKQNTDVDGTDSNCDSSIKSDKAATSLRKYYLFQKCTQCGETNSVPQYKYCLKCYKVRKNFFPPRPKGKKRKTERKVTQSSSVDDNAMKSACDSGISIECSQDLYEKSKETVDKDLEQVFHRKELCGTCLSNPKDGGFVHQNIVHVFSCYRCSVKTLKQIGRCPVCNSKVRQKSCTSRDDQNGSSFGSAQNH